MNLEKNQSKYIFRLTPKKYGIKYKIFLMIPIGGMNSINGIVLKVLDILKI